MHGSDIDTTRSATTRLREVTGGSDPWMESGLAGCRGGFAWQDDHGNSFDITISLFHAAPRTAAEQYSEHLREAWQTVMLGDDSACTADPDAWRHAVKHRDEELGKDDELGKKVGRP